MDHQIAILRASCFYVGALLKAFKRKTITWIVTAVLSGVFFFFALLAFIAAHLSNQSPRSVALSASSEVNRLAQQSKKFFDSSASNATPSPSQQLPPVKTETKVITGEELGLDLPALAEKARKAVVFIVCADATGKIIKTGSGFFVSEDGCIVTNWHVVDGAVSVQAKLESGAIYNIEGILASSSDLDLAVLKADARDVQFLSVEQRVVPPKAGTRIAVIGSPLAFENTLSEGIVSATRAEGNWLQISAPISPGSSGSPVLDRHGNVVGVATLVLTGGQSLNFARSSRDLVGLLRDIPKNAKAEPFHSKTQPAVFDDPDFKAAVEANRNKNTAVALEILNRLSQKFPNDRFVLFQRGFALFDLGLYEEAFAVYRQCVKIDPTEYAAWTNMERAAYYLGMYAEALNAAKQAIHIKPDEPDAWHLLASVYYTTNQLQLAYQADQKAKALEERKKHVEELEKRRGWAMAAAQRETRDDPENPHGWFALAEVYTEMNQLDLANEAKRKGEELKAKQEEKAKQSGVVAQPTSTATASPGEPVLGQERRVAIIIAHDSSGLYVRSDPDSKSRILVTLQNGDHVFLERGFSINKSPPEQVRWQQVTTQSGSTGWIRADYVAPFEDKTESQPTPVPDQIYTVINLSGTEELWVHTHPRADSPALVKLHRGDHVYVRLGRVRTDNPPPTTFWQKVTSMNGYTGWVKADYIASGD